MTKISQFRYLAYLALGIGGFSLLLSAIFVRYSNAPRIINSFYRMTIEAILTTLPFLSLG